jgi:predicted deacetylase
MAIHSPSGPSVSVPVPPPGNRWLVVSFHGLAPHTQRPCQELLMLLAELGVPRASLLVVPSWHGVGSILDRPFFLRWLRSLAEEGHEVCLAGEEELAEDRVTEGEKILGEAGLPARGLITPVRRLSPAAREALRGHGFEYTITPRHLHLLREDVRLEAPTVAFSTRSFLRRALSPLVGRARFAASRRQPILRVSAHPEDLYEHRVRLALVSVLQRALADREPVTCGELARAAAPSHV